MKKIVYFLLIICSFFFLQKVEAKNYTVYKFDFQQVTGSVTGPLNVDENMLYYTFKDPNYLTFPTRLDFALPEPNKVYNADEVRFTFYYSYANYYDKTSGSFSSSCSGTNFIEDKEGYIEGFGEFDHEGWQDTSCFYAVDQFISSKVKTSISIQVVQKYTTITCDIIGTPGMGYLSVSCPLTTNRDEISGFTAYIESDASMYLSEVGISQFMSVGLDDGSKDVITGAINDQTSTMNKNQQQTNNRLDNLNNSITSNSNDTSSDKCGLLCKLKGIFTGIIELPSKLVNLLIDALKALFVPTDQQLYEIINDSKELSENFGFVGESINFFITIFTSLLGLVNANGCVELPEFTVGATSMFESVTFWESQLICLNDNVILSTHIDTIRTITSIVLVCLFINFAAAKFFSILSKNDSVQTSRDAYDVRRDNS